MQGSAHSWEGNVTYLYFKTLPPKQQQQKNPTYITTKAKRRNISCKKPLTLPRTLYLPIREYSIPPLPSAEV